MMKHEPVMTGAIVQSALALLASFGLDLTAEQIAAIFTVSALVIGWITRRRVTPSR